MNEKNKGTKDMWKGEVTVIAARNVGATAALQITQLNVKEIVLTDIAEGALRDISTMAT